MHIVAIILLATWAVAGFMVFIEEGLSFLEDIKSFKKGMLFASFFGPIVWLLMLVCLFGVGIIRLCETKQAEAISDYFDKIKVWFHT